MALPCDAADVKADNDGRVLHAGREVNFQEESDDIAAKVKVVHGSSSAKELLVLFLLVWTLATVKRQAHNDIL